MSGSVIWCDGKPVPVNAQVQTWKEAPELGFPNLRTRKVTHGIVLHTTGGSGLADQVHRTLVARGLSIHFVINPDGLIVQMADCKFRCSPDEIQWAHNRTGLGTDHARGPDCATVGTGQPKTIGRSTCLEA